jgi:hypothetical protein
VQTGMQRVPDLPKREMPQDQARQEMQEGHLHQHVG